MPWITKIQDADSSVVLRLPLVVGRGSNQEIMQKFPPPWSYYRINNKYLSRINLTIEEKNENLSELVITQFGKNPTFWSSSCTQLTVGKTLIVSREETELGDSQDSKKMCALHFPRELNLPLVTFKFLSDAVDTVSVPLTALNFELDNKSHEDDSNIEVPPMTGKLLDQVLKEQSSLSFNLTPVVKNIPAQSEVALFPPKSSLGKQWGFNIGIAANNDSLKLTDASLQNLNKPKMGCWEWKAFIKGKDNDPKSWRKYSKDVADHLEANFRKGDTPVVNIDSTYAVCFDDKDKGMVQFRLDNHTKWRPVRRRGGDKVARVGVKRVRVIFSDTDIKGKKSKSESSSDSWIVSDDSDESSSDEESSEDSDTESSDISSSSSENHIQKKKK